MEKIGITIDPLADYIFLNPSQKTVRNKLNSNFNSNPRMCIKKIEEIDPILQILCINCQESINIEYIETHSRSCLTISSLVLSIENSSPVEEINFKIAKLKTCLENVQKNSKLKPGDRNYILILLRLISNILANPFKIELDKAKHSLSSVITSFRGSLSIQVYIDRFSVLLSSYIFALSEISQTTSKNLEEIIKNKAKNNDTNSPLENEYTNQSNLLVKNRKKSSSPFMFQDRKIDEVDSEVGSNKSMCSAFSTIGNLDEGTRSPIMKNFEMATEEDLQKYFYSIFLSLKIKYDTIGKKIEISIKKLYEDALEKKIPPDEWWEFIVSNLKNPNPVLVEKVPRLQFGNLKQNFEVIIEEDSSR